MLSDYRTPSLENRLRLARAFVVGQTSSHRKGSLLFVLMPIVIQAV